jgi:raffinose/stachyose/melibiose transport system substrate-binding protein
MFKPDNWTKLAWVNGVCMSAQNFSQFATGNETEVQKEFTDYVKNATNLSGTPLGDMGSSEFKTASQDLTQELSIGTITTDDFLKGLANASK